MAYSGKFEQLRNKCIRLGEYFKDPDFPPYTIDPDVYRDPDDPRTNWEITWKRPHEIFSDPIFVVDKATRFDLNQGAIGNCWYIAGAATLATRQDLWRKVVPKNQGFDQGIFHFNFWRFGKWKEEIIDDRLPTYVDNQGRAQLCFCSNTDEPNEMWGPLMEKAYAKCYGGSYEALDGGYTEDALVDFTGGIGKRHNLQDPNMDRTKLWEMLLHDFKMNSLMGAAVPGNGEDELPNGLVTGHAYSITDVTKVWADGKECKLVRLRNPWGHHEWDGPWSDSSQLWDRIDERERQRLGLVIEDDGEFWMRYETLLQHFDEIQTCHLPTKKRLLDKRKWKQIPYPGTWNAGDNELESSKNSANPSYSITLKRPDDGGNDGDGLCTLIISLMQENRGAGDVVPICFDVHKVRGVKKHMVHRESTPDYGNCQDIPEYYRGMPTHYQAMPEYYREITEELRVSPGTYEVIPSTLDTNTECDFLLRFCIEKDADKDYPIRDHSVGGPTVRYHPVADHPVRSHHVPVREHYIVMDQYPARDSCCPTCTLL